ncbi:hypothetical protein [Bacillus rhizoplanae]|uniref:hypothetical protein n=1 Tax=Bacillus rhizoplanae TaxID=2880966 RepID=UPI003D1DD15D
MPLKKKRRITKITNASKKYPKLTLQQALDIVISGKRAEGCRDRTLRDYMKMWGYFTDWLFDNYEVEYIEELTTDTFRNYINYMKKEVNQRVKENIHLDADKRSRSLEEIQKGSRQPNDVKPTLIHFMENKKPIFLR